MSYESMQPERIYDPVPSEALKGPVVYWMSREQRVRDNWGLQYAMGLAERTGSWLAVVFTLVPGFLDATIRQYDFMLWGLREVESGLRDLEIPFFLLPGSPPETLKEFIAGHGVNTVVTDLDPLRIKRKWKKDLVELTRVKMIEVDSHNIVPARYVSNKVEFGAYTLRPKIHRLLDRFLEDFPDMEPVNYGQGLPHPVDWEKVESSLRVNTEVPPVKWITPGEAAAGSMLDDFIEHRLDDYASRRNDPNLDGLSGLSPYFHFGQIAPQRVALEIIRRIPRSDSTDAFLEEMIVRRELSDNFCLYNPDYDHPKGFHDWAKKTHQQHAADEREYLYSRAQFERAETHDPLWNSAQNEMVFTGKMHGYMRMYWAKKILEWTENVETAMKVAIYLNDKYELDGRDPNGYTGIAWSMGGVHDRAWQERPVFGKIRYMNYNGCKRKFDVNHYMERIREIGKDL